MRRIRFVWKDDFQNEPWYVKNPAHSYLSIESKLSILEEYILEEEDRDSEATFEVVEWKEGVD